MRDFGPRFEASPAVHSPANGCPLICPRGKRATGLFLGGAVGALGHAWVPSSAFVG
jgi:hypothetical protein